MTLDFFIKVVRFSVCCVYYMLCRFICVHVLYLRRQSLWVNMVIADLASVFSQLALESLCLCFSAY